MALPADEYSERRQRLMDLQDEWRRTFEEDIGIGFDIGLGEIPLLEQCLRDRDPQPLHDHLGAIPVEVDR